MKNIRSLLKQTFLRRNSVIRVKQHKTATTSSNETYYLVDFENVNENTFSYSKLGKHDHIHFFYTKNASKISFESLSSINLKETELCFHAIPAGKQSLDMHLISYLGYLIAINRNRKFKLIVISKDSDYDNVISFWKNNGSYNITRQISIESLPQNNSTQKSVAQKLQLKPAPPILSKHNKHNRTQLNSSVQKALSSAGLPSPVINGVASIVVKHCEENNFANNVHTELRTIYPNYSDIYTTIKPIISKYPSKNGNKNIKSTAQPNNEIRQILSRASLNNDIISYVTSLCSQNINTKNKKQTIYTAIVAKYGQKQGLKIYNHIKKNL